MDRENFSIPTEWSAIQEPTAEQRLWAAVIQRALQDIEGSDAFERKRAVAWFRTAEFSEVADLAGLNPETVRRIVAEQVEAAREKISSRRRKAA